MASKLTRAGSVVYRTYSVLAAGFVYLMLFGMITGLTMALLTVVLYSVTPLRGAALAAVFCVSLLPASLVFYVRWRGAKWKERHPDLWAEERTRKVEAQRAKLVARAERSQDGNWVVTSVVAITGGSVGPAIAYYSLTEPNYGTSLGAWRFVILPIGTWLLTGLFVSGITTLWVAGVKRQANWPARADAAFGAWCKAGLWLVAIAIAIAVGIIAISGFSEYMSGISRGTALIAGLLIMILFALWRIGDNLPRR